MSGQKETGNPGIELAVLVGKTFSSIVTLVRDSAVPLVSHSRKNKFLRAGLYGTLIFLTVGMFASLGGMTYPVSRAIDTANAGEPAMNQGEAVRFSSLCFLGGMACSLPALGLSLALSEADEE